MLISNQGFYNEFDYRPNINIDEFRPSSNEVENNDIYTSAKNEKKRRDKTIFSTFAQAVTGENLGYDNKNRYDIVIGIVDKKFHYAISQNDFRPAAASAPAQAALGAALLATTACSYALNGQGLVTKAMITATHSLAIPKISKIPYLPPMLLPLVFSACLITVNHFKSNLFTDFLTITVVALFALMLKKMGKSLASGGWMSAKPLILPVNLAIAGVKAPRELTRFEVLPQDDSLKTDKKVQLVITEHDGDVFYQVQVEDKIFDPVKMASKVAEDDDDDDEEEKKVKKSEGKTPSPLKALQKWGISSGATVGTIALNYFFGQGITTGAVSSIATAGWKANLRKMPLVNGYGFLLSMAGIFYTIKRLAPKTVFGDIVLETLTVMALSTLASLATKDMKDRIITPKRPKCEQLWSAAWIQEKFNLDPSRPYMEEPALVQVLKPENNGKTKVALTINDRNIEMRFKVKGEKLCGEYLGITEKQRKELGLARLKVQKPGAWAMNSFLVTSIAVTLFASWATKKAQLSSIKGDVHIDTTKLGEGVVSNICNSVFVTFMKQAGKNIPCLLVHGGILPLTIGAVTLERYLMNEGNLPFLFAFVFTSSYIGMVQKYSKMSINQKQYHPDNWLTPKFAENLPELLCKPQLV